MNYNMLSVLLAFIIMELYNLRRLISNKESIKVLITYVVITASSLVIGLLLAAGRRPASPAEWIQWIFKMIGVVK
ncbi:MAG: hypothetical protein GX041_07185 [Clostridiales bacterium]|nr:hypothetical protein [Clostridiales bacterium]